MSSNQTFTAGFRNVSIRKKYAVVMLLLAIVPLLVSTLFFLNYFGNVTREENAKVVNQVLDSNVARLDEWMQSKIGFMQSLIKQRKEFQTADPAKIIPVLKVLDESDEQVTTFNVIGANGDGVDTGFVALNIADRDHFKKAKETKQPVIADMLISKKTNKYVLPIDVPIVTESGDFAGMLSASVSPDILTTLTASIRVADTGYGYIISGAGEYYTHPDPARIGKSLAEFETAEGAKKAFETIVASPSGSVTYVGSDGKEVITYYDTIPNTAWKLIVTVPTGEVFAKVSEVQRIAVMFMIVIIALAAAVSIAITRSISKPIENISAFMGRVAEGDLSRRLDVRSGDEIGRMSQNINRMVDSTGDIVRKIHHAVSQVSAASNDLLQAAGQSAQAAAQIAAAIEEVANGAESQLMGAEQSARAMEESAAGVQRIAESSGVVSDQTANVASEVEAGYVDIQAAIAQMNVIAEKAHDSSAVIGELSAQSEQIGQIVDVITDIANQTSLLSLNASIEAARAGEQGRGFAVVANEVKKLAEQTAHSVSGIADIVRLIQASANKAVESMRSNVSEISGGIVKMEQIGEAFANIRASVREVSAQIQEVSATTEQMSAGTEQITASILDMVGISKQSADNSQSVAASAEEQTAITEDIASSAQSVDKLMKELSELVRVFKLE
ncbi:methyl-accepting chemotaxis protein [Paenibacillus sp. GYB003]|uniref:methyl-accepting chemotaxis protein n=1 Tax=Paenibacillus sp. GYB003 TaxID=2994392 RepID=UPI002F96B723